LPDLKACKIRLAKPHKLNQQKHVLRHLHPQQSLLDFVPLTCWLGLEVLFEKWHSMSQAWLSCAWHGWNSSFDPRSAKSCQINSNFDLQKVATYSKQISLNGGFTQWKININKHQSQQIQMLPSPLS
jgi:hypothetical protein